MTHETPLQLPMQAERLTPHRRPMLLIDTLVSCTGETAVTEMTVQPDNPFVDEDGVLDPLCICELAAQSFAAKQGYDAAAHATPPGKGFLVGVRSATAGPTIFVGDTLRIHCRATARIDAFIVAECELFRDAEWVGAAEIKLYTPD